MSETALVTIVQQFGWDATNAAAKILIQLRNGDQYFCWHDWYDSQIIPKVGSVITLTYSGYGSSLDLHKLINTGIGKETRVLRFVKAN